MKKRNVFVATCVTLMLVTGCSAQKGEVSSAVPTQIVSTSIAESTLDVSSTKNAENRMDEEESTLTGTISDIKDFMFIITDGDGVDYVLSFCQRRRYSFCCLHRKIGRNRSIHWNCDFCDKKVAGLIVNWKYFGLVKEERTVYREGVIMAPFAT